ncbi:MAG: polyprenyl diphosphate synthase [Spirochaetia bacterium]|nr:polyprenyl diphosphate synthase [Spirochaetia bacterium]
MASDAHPEIELSSIKTFPVHVAIVMDGNGRWAKNKGLSRSEGHRAGGEALDRLLDFVVTLPIPFFSLYAFSTENWKRPVSEVQALWDLMNEFFEKRVDHCIQKGIKIRASGDVSKLPLLNRKVLKRVIKKTENCSHLTVNFCLNYGSRDEILHAAEKIMQERLEFYKNGQKNKAEESITEEEFEKYLYTHPIPPVDLFLRPGGEKRISNFLLWQSAYAELYFTDKLFPDFDQNEMLKALAWFEGRDRRYGSLSE